VRRSLFPLLAAAVVAVAGLAGLIYGTLLATTLAAPTHTVGRVSGINGVRAVDTANGVLDLDGPQVQIRATASSGGPVFVGIARADDVTAYLADASRADITRVFGDGRLTTVRAGTQSSLPNPAAVDIWVTSRSGNGTVSLVWPDTPGPWRVVVAGDGTTGAPAEITLDWSRAPRSNSAPAFVTVGLLLLAGGLLALLALRVRRRDSGEDDADTPATDTPVTDTPVTGGIPATGGTPATGLLRPVPSPPPGDRSDEPEVPA
jgi:hypothetical protein